MKFYTHSTEADRIAAVNELQIIGSVNEQIFDDIALLASVICKAPIAFVGFIDSEIQWFKSITGIELKSIPREISFCTVMIQSGERLITENLEEHELLRHNPFVTGDLNLRSCISIPIKNKENLILGSVCAVDFLPRKFTSLEVDAMEALARQAAEHLDVRRGIIRQQKAAQIEQRILELQLIRTEFRLSSMLEKLPGIVLYETSIHKEILHDKEREYISNNIVGMLGYPIEKYLVDVSYFVGLIHPDDFKTIDLEFQKWEQNDYLGVLNLEFRCLHANGEYIWINDLAVCVKTDVNKNNWYISGVLIDITHRRNNEEKLRETNSHLNALFNNSLQAFILLDKKLNILAFNRVAQIGSISFWGKDLVEGDCILQILSKEYQQQYREFCDIAFSGKSHIVSEIELKTYNSRKVWIEISFVPIVSDNGEVTQICFSGLNITKRKTVQARLEKAEHNYRSIVQNAIIGIFQVLPTGEFLSVNKTMASMLGFDSPEELMESRDAMDNYVLPESRSEFIDLLNKHGHISGFEFQGKKEMVKLYGLHKALELYTKKPQIPKK
ncbi:MAG: PAS domain S-box protein [Bacteroidetes bacterium]|nr:PAS domain S-box protein [Bacteroidota bacterium]